MFFMHHKCNYVALNALYHTIRHKNQKFFFFLNKILKFFKLPNHLKNINIQKIFLSRILLIKLRILGDTINKENILRLKKSHKYRLPFLFQFNIIFFSAVRVIMHWVYAKNLNKQTK